MIQDLKANIEKLIALYETERQRSDELSEKLRQSEAAVATCKEQITELNRQIDNLKLSEAFSASGSNPEAKARLDKLIKEIDKCIKWLEE